MITAHDGWEEMCWRAEWNYRQSFVVLDIWKKGSTHSRWLTWPWTLLAVIKWFFIAIGVFRLGLQSWKTNSWNIISFCRLQPSLVKVYVQVKTHAGFCRWSQRQEPLRVNYAIQIYFSKKNYFSRARFSISSHFFFSTSLSACMRVIDVVCSSQSRSLVWVLLSTFYSRRTKLGVRLAKYFFKQKVFLATMNFDDCLKIDDDFLSVPAWS